MIFKAVGKGRMVVDHVVAIFNIVGTGESDGWLMPWHSCDICLCVMNMSGLADGFCIFMGCKTRKADDAPW